MGSMPMRKRLQRPFGCRLRRRSGRAAVQPHPPLRRCEAPPLPCRGGELSRLLLQRALRLGDDRGKRLAGISLDRKVLADIAMHEGEAFSAIIAWMNWP